MIEVIICKTVVGLWFESSQKILYKLNIITAACLKYWNIQTFPAEILKYEIIE